MISLNRFGRLGAALIVSALILPQSDLAAQLDITRVGKHRLLRPDGSVISEHDDLREAYEKASRLPPGTYTLETANERITVKAGEPTAPASTPTPEPVATPRSTATQSQRAVAPMPPTSGAHGYYEALSKLPNAQAAYSLRSAKEVAQYRRGNYLATVEYDPTTEAARWHWPEGATSAQFLELPISLDAPTSGTNKLLIVSDHYWDANMSFKAPNGEFGGWKWLQVTSAAGPGSSRQRIWFEPQMRWLGGVHDVNSIVKGQQTKPFASAKPMPIALFSAREYLGPVAPTTNTGQSACGIPYGGDTLAPILNCFAGYADRWTRTWIEISLIAGQPYAEISWWMADELQDPKPILLKARQTVYPPIRQFWFEYNTSYDQRVGPAMNAWGRNVVVLKDVPDPTVLMEKPKR